METLSNLSCGAFFRTHTTEGHIPNRQIHLFYVGNSCMKQELAFLRNQVSDQLVLTAPTYSSLCSAMAKILKCSADEYLKKWVPIFFKMKDALKDLDALALPPVAEAIWLLVDKGNGELGAAGDLAVALKTPAEAA